MRELTIHEPRYPRFKKLRYSDYTTTGIKIYTNGIAWRWDAYHSCLNACTYCFARALEKGALERAGVIYDPMVGRLGDLNRMVNKFQRIFDKMEMDENDFIDWCLVERWCMELGTMGEPFLDVDQEIGITYGFLQLLKNYNFPLFVCTKGNLLIRNEAYYDALLDIKPNGLIVDVSLISINEKLLKKYEPLVPLVSERLKLIERLCDDGVNVIVSCRPFLAGVTDENFDEYIETLCRLGIKGIHMRQFYITGILVRRWKKWIEEHKSILKRHGIGYKYKGEYLEPFFKRALEIAEPQGVVISGGSKHISGISHKTDWDVLDETAKRAIFPYTVSPMLTKLRGKDSHVMIFDEYCKPLLQKDDPILDADIRIDPETMILTHERSCQIKPRLGVLINFRDILTHSLWDGWGYKGISRDGKIATSDIVSDTQDVIRIVKNGKPVLDENGHKMFAYLPERFKGRDIEVKELKERGIWK